MGLTSALASSLLSASLAGAAQPLFLEDPVFGLSSVATDVLPADLDGDGRSDLAVAHGQLAQLAVLLSSDPTGSTGGPFAFAQRAYAVGLSPFSLEAGDLNGDGKPDLLSANSGSASLSLLLNGGDGGFLEAREHAADQGPRIVRLADLDGDGALDAVAVSFIAEGRGSMGVLLGDGKGGLRSGASMDVGDNPHALAVADFDGDGSADAAVGHTDALGLFRGRGDGTFAAEVAAEVRGGPAAAVAGDFDRDGLADLAVLAVGDGDNDAALLFAEHAGEGRLKVAVVSTDAGRGLRLDAGGGFGYLSSADLNGDGLRDLVTEADAGKRSALRVHRSRGDGSFVRVPDDLHLRDFLTDAVFADLDGGGVEDLGYGTPASQLVVHRGLSPGRFDLGSPAIELAAGPRQVAVLDADSDGAPDLLARSSSFIHLVRGRPPRGFAAPERLTGVRSLQDMAIADLDGDGRADAAATDIVTSSVVLLLLDARGAVARTLDIRVRDAPGVLAAADFDADGDADLAVADLNVLVLSVLFDPASEDAGKLVEVELDSGQTAVAAGDADLDGALDLAVATRSGLRLLLGDGRGAFPRRRELDLLPSARALRVAEVDGDGVPDLIGISSSGSSLERVTAPARDERPEAKPVSQAFELHAAAVQDLDRDGIVDIACAASRPSSGLVVFRGRGAGAFGEPEVHRAGADARGFAIADLDVDGALDAAVAAVVSKAVVVLWGNPAASGRRTFVRADRDLDGAINITDVIVTLNGLFRGGEQPPCADAADADDNGEVNLSDAVYSLNFQFLGGPEPPPPYPSAGEDPTPDELGCEGG
ncbi:MAG: VCBS repeat-containing protein [Planctomycetes bacterium]|nr:VCBS repeat-containing protein [Planctomycetota bacterium]